MSFIHPNAIVHDGAEIGEGTIVEAYAIIGPEVKIGKNNIIHSYAVIEGKTILGDNNEIFYFASIGAPPQDISYRGEPTEVIIGNGNIIREGVTIHRGTARGIGVTQIGNNNYFMAYSHVAHDCVIGNHVIMASYSALGGHVVVEDHAVIGGLVGVHQYVRIGRYAFIGGHTGVSMDVPPFTLVAGSRAQLYGLNIVGLKRANFPPPVVSAIKRAYRTIFRSGLTLERAIASVKSQGFEFKEVEEFVRFIEDSSKRGIIR